MPTGAYPNEAKPLAEVLSTRLRSTGISVVQVEKHWEDLRLVCEFQDQTYFVDLTFYVEAQPLMFSLEIRHHRKSLFAWLRRSQLRALIEQIDQILHAHPAFSEIDWHRSGDLRKGATGTEHPFN